MKAKIPTFGVEAPGVDYLPRPAAYAVILDKLGLVAVVRGKGGAFLPGGGSYSGESAEDTVMRETIEELARPVRILGRIGEAVQFFCADNRNYRMCAVFLEAEFIGPAFAAGDHELEWLPMDDLDQQFFHRCHAWAVREAYTQKGQDRRR